MNYILLCLAIIIVGCIIVRRRNDKKQQKEDNDLPTLSKKQKDFFRGKPFDNEFRNWYDEIKENKN
jgi:hypothetical protein